MQLLWVSGLGIRIMAMRGKRKEGAGQSGRDIRREEGVWPDNWIDCCAHSFLSIDADVGIIACT